MHKNKFNSITKTDKSVYMTDGVQHFPQTVVKALESIHAWYSMMHAVKYPTEFADFYIVYAENGRYFKTDQGEKCAQLMIHDRRTNDCWLESCMVDFRDMDSIVDIAKYVEDVKKFDMTTLEQKAAFAKSDYPWQICGVMDDMVGTYQEMNKAKERAAK